MARYLAGIHYRFNRCYDLADMLPKLLRAMALPLAPLILRSSVA